MLPSDSAGPFRFTRTEAAGAFAGTTRPVDGTTTWPRSSTSCTCSSGSASGNQRSRYRTPPYTHNSRRPTRASSEPESAADVADRLGTDGWVDAAPRRSTGHRLDDVHSGTPPDAGDRAREGQALHAAPRQALRAPAVRIPPEGHEELIHRRGLAPRLRGSARGDDRPPCPDILAAPTHARRAAPDQRRLPGDDGSGAEFVIPSASPESAGEDHPAHGRSATTEVRPA